jgi:hypothetical protein
MAEDLVKAIADCRRHAAEFKQEAKKAGLPSRRRYFSEMADCWLVMARDYQLRLSLQRSLIEFNGQLTNYIYDTSDTTH